MCQSRTKVSSISDTLGSGPNTVYHVDDLGLKHARCEVDNLHLGNDAGDALHEFQMSWIFLQVKLSVLLVLEFENERMGDPILQH